MFLTCRAAALAAYLALTALPAGAAITADELWRDWQSVPEGQTAHAASQTRSAGELALAGLRFDRRLEGGTLSIGIETATLAEDGSGGVRATIPAGQVLSLELTPDGGAATSARFRLTGSGVTLDASGAPGAVDYAIAAPEAALVLLDLDLGGEPAEASLDVAFTALAGTLGATGDASLAASSFGLQMAMADPATGNRVSSTTTQEAVRVAFSRAPDATHIETSGGALTARSRQEDATGFVTETAVRQSASRSSLVAKAGRADLSSHVDGFAFDLTLPAIPIGPTGIDAERLALSVSLPLAPAEDVQTVDIGAVFDGLTIGSEIWAMFDPAGAIPRDAGGLVVDAELGVKFDGTAELPGIASPAEPESLRIHRLSLDIAGASLDATGRFTFHPVSDPAMQAQSWEAVGQLDLSVTGALALLQALVTAGTVSNQEAVGLQLMLAMFTRPGEGDSLTSTIVTEPGGGLTVNGTRLQ